MRQHFSHDPTRQMPHISGPHSLCLEAFYYLAEDCLYPVSDAAQPPTPFGIRIKASLLVWSKHIKPLFAKLLSEFRLPVVAISQAVAFCLRRKRLYRSQITQI